jgi:UDP-N-acetylmuramate: L-alanyl-gamma-D-glutamyl-meso-diaminopimelate ligase
MEAILDAGQRYVSGPQWLAEHILPGRHVLAVAGTHGKTGTAAMLAWILEHAGRQPGFLVGGVPANFGVSARVGESDLFVIEADEYDTAFFDKRSKFVHYPARTAILNNLEFDHADIFSDLAAIERQFHHFVRILPKSGLIVANGRDEALRRVLTHGCWTPVERFGLEDAWQAGAPDAENGFDVRWASDPLGRVRWSQAGEHNRLNALAAIAAARHAGVEPGRAIEALASFTGVRRRLELRGTVHGVAVYDDFAHHPTAIRATLEGLRAQRGAGRILAVLEPRSNTMKLGIMKDRLAASLAGADRAYVYAADLGWDAAAALRPLGERARSFEQLDALVAALAAEARPGDRVLVMSNGGFGGVHGKLLAAIGAQAAA